MNDMSDGGREADPVILPEYAIGRLKQEREAYADVMLRAWPKMQSDADEAAQKLIARLERSKEAASAARGARISAASATSTGAEASIHTRVGPPMQIPYPGAAVMAGILCIITWFNAPFVAGLVVAGAVMGVTATINHFSRESHQTAIGNELKEIRRRRSEEIDAATSEYTATVERLDAEFRNDAARLRGAFLEIEDEMLLRFEGWKNGHLATIAECKALSYSLSDCIEPISSELRDYVLLGWRHLPSVASLDPGYLQAVNKVCAIAKLEPLTARTTVAPPPGPEFHRLIGGSVLSIFRENGTDPRLSAAVSAVLLRILLQMPPGKVLFTFMDPIGQGQNVARLLQLGDHDDRLINVRAWTDREQIRNRLRDLTAHIENVIQKYLRTDHRTIDEYNLAAQEIAEPYRVLVVFDYPEQFDSESAAELRRIVQNGPRCGVLTIFVQRNKAGQYGIEGVMPPCSYKVASNGLWEDTSGTIPGPIEPDIATADVKALIDRIGPLAKASFVVEVPFEKMVELAAADGVGRKVWGENSANGFKIPLGRTAANKVQYLELGSGLSHHALVAGRPGSGKSNLMHVIIAGAARLYSPTELQLYLVDFKKGVEFQPYADRQLPHARVIAVDSEREFGVSVLRGLVAKMNERNDLFSRTGVQNLSKYRERNPDSQDMPRILLLVDEFQEMFMPDDSLAREASHLLDQIVRMGRSAGIHALLGSQTLAGTLAPPATLNLMTVRIALQCSEADSQLILAPGNSGARRLGRPGEGVYNATNGLEEGNSFFQVSMFNERDSGQVLDEVAHLGTAQAEAARPIVFKGFEPASLAQCMPLIELAETGGGGKAAPAGWLGEPIAIDDPIRIDFTREGGSSLLVVHRDEAEGIGVVAATMLGLAARRRTAASRFEIVDLAMADSEWADTASRVADALPKGCCEIYGRRDIPQLLHGLAQELARRQEMARPPAESIYLVILGLHRARALRLDEPEVNKEYGNAAESLARLLKYGPEVGLHFIAWVDGMTGMERTLDSSLLREIGLRCAGPLDARGSDILFDCDAAARLGERPHRMVIAEEKRIGVIRVFRPYGIPPQQWLQEYGQKLNALEETQQ